MELILNPIFQSVALSVIVAQLVKTIIDVVTHHHFDWRWLFRGAGMPSSHTATVVALALSVYFVEGLTTLFIITLVFAAIVVRDVIGDKVFATHQENIINRLIQQIVHHEKVSWNHLIGHTLVEVFAGTLIAVAITLLIFFI